MINLNANLFQSLKNSRLLNNEPMKNHTSFRLGGNAEWMILPETVEDAVAAVSICREAELPYYVMGNGSNLLVLDEGYHGVVIKLRSLTGVSLEGNVIHCESGVLLSSLSDFALKNSLTGLEFASGIPGTVGGAVCMNAGAYDGEMQNVVREAVVLDRDGEIATISNSELEFGYRHSIIAEKGYIVLKVAIELKNGDFTQIKKKISEFDALRRAKQPLEYPSAGSAFKRPEGHYAGKLIMDSGLSGYSIGGAFVSDKHCGFIVNKGGTSDDIIRLIDHIVSTVYEKFNVTLEPEIKILSENRQS